MVGGGGGYFEANIRQYEKMLSEYSLQHVFFASN
jgi:hypothetical protein